VQRKFRLTRSEDVRRVRHDGKSFAHPLVVLVAQASDGQHLRVGVTAGKTTGTAVQRNRAKRLLREAMRPLLSSIEPHWDMILIARPAIGSATLEQTRSAVAGLLRRARIIPTDEH
jgi:ribonuclease P protein component